MACGPNLAWKMACGPYFLQNWIFLQVRDKRKSVELHEKLKNRTYLLFSMRNYCKKLFSTCTFNINFFFQTFKIASRATQNPLAGHMLDTPDLNQPIFFNPFGEDFEYENMNLLNNFYFLLMMLHKNADFLNNFSIF